MTDVMTLDEVFEHYNIRRLDNRFRVVVMTRPGINIYVSIEWYGGEDLGWKRMQRVATASFGYDPPKAKAYAEHLYANYQPYDSAVGSRKPVKEPCPDCGTDNYCELCM